MRALALLALTAAAAGCAASQPVDPAKAQAELSQLPGGGLPVRQTCREQAALARQQLPIQVRSELSEAASATAYAECADVLTVFVSVAMQTGDTTETGLRAVLSEVEGAESQLLVDTCDERYRAWRLLQDPGGRFPRPPAEGGPTETAQYDAWMDRCFRVLRPLSRR